MVQYFARFCFVEEVPGLPVSAGRRIEDIQPEEFTFSTRSVKAAVKEVRDFERDLTQKGCDLAYPVLEVFERVGGGDLLSRYREYVESERQKHLVR